MKRASVRTRLAGLAVVALLGFVLAGCKVSPEEHLRRGNLALASGENEKAVGEFSAGLADAPGDAALHERLAFTLATRGGRPDQAKAEEEYRRAVTIDPSFAAAHAGLGNLLWNSGRKDEAKASYRKFLDLPPIADPLMALERAKITVLLANDNRNEQAKESLSEGQ